MVRERRKISVICGLLVASVVLQSHAGPEKADSVVAKSGMVVSDHRLASQVGVEVLKSGGNAIDAAVATAFALAVTHPSAGNIGGGGFIVYHGADGTITTFDFREKAPMAATAKMFLNKEGKLTKTAGHVGLLSVGVPGTVAGLALAHKRLGAKPWAQLVQPAIDLAEKGFPVSKALNNEVKRLTPSLGCYPSSAKVFLKNGAQPYEPGEILRQPDLAATLKRIRDSGRDGFYKGRTAQLLVKMMRAHRGLITAKDLAAYQAVERKPIHGTYRGYDIYAMGPPSSGGVALVEMLNILEGFDLAGMGRNSPLYAHVLTEAMRRAFADRARHIGDPDFNRNIPIERLISKDHANKMRASISLTSASQSDPTKFGDVYEGADTTHLSVVDGHRNAVSLTYTLEESYGSKIVVEGAGFLLNNEMGDFNLVPGRTDTEGLIGTPPNQIAPQKRMLSSMTPTIVAKDGKPVLVIGSPGGRTIINTVLQVVLNVVDHKMPIADAIDAKRFHHQWLPDVSAMERGFLSPAMLRVYERFGHKTKTASSQ
ncbi:gamma-glutamyltransferase, partial [Candidatus Sumerlaeota bacterium]|nr:gamma-glutamyltransferase [Candidatus Sumerlaeota bacterium]